MFIRESGGEDSVHKIQRTRVSEAPFSYCHDPCNRSRWPGQCHAASWDCSESEPNNGWCGMECNGCESGGCNLQVMAVGMKLPTRGCSVSIVTSTKYADNNITGYGTNVCAVGEKNGLTSITLKTEKRGWLFYSSIEEGIHSASQSPLGLLLPSGSPSESPLSPPKSPPRTPLLIHKDLLELPKRPKTPDVGTWETWEPNHKPLPTGRDPQPRDSLATRPASQMLGKLFNLGAGSGAGALPSAQTPSHKPFSLESVQEDILTRNLLFPDPHDLYEHRLNQFYPLSSGLSPLTSSSSAFDYNGDIELDVRDVRIIIMQDALSSVAASLLYDSQPPPPVSPAYVDRPSATAGSYSVQEPRRTPVSPRKPSITSIQRPIVIQPGSPKARQGAFDRRPSVHSRNQGYAETESQRAWREYREELATFSSCIFGNSELMAYKGTSTKVHVVPSETRPHDHASMFADGRSSMGRSSMRASRLSQSFSSENPPSLTSPPTPGVASRMHDRKKVLITRLFPVNLPLDEDITPPGGHFSEETTGYPFPKPTDDSKVKKKLKQKRTPMYAVALVISLPPSPSHHAPANSTRSAFRGSSSYTEQDSFPSSFSSARRSGWTLVGPGTGGYGLDSFETSFSSDMEDQIDSITQHWDIIMRTLSHLQTTVASTLFTMLRQADITSPDPLPSIPQMVRASSMSSRRSDDGAPVKPPKTNAKYITLLPNCLLDNRYIKNEVDGAKTRIVAGIRASRVTTGQNRWPIWREEARRVAKWAGGRDQGFFIYNLLTGFLATHTDWLQALSPQDYRRRHFLQKQARAEEDSLVPARTVIVSDNKIAARRLVFLLAAFLPAAQQMPGIRAHRPSTSTSMGTLSQSPPSFVVPILKEESLRRKINRRTGSRVPSHSRNLSLQSGTRGTGIPPSLNHLSMESRHERRASDATSIRTAHLPIRGGDATSRKSSAATTATITPETSVPHFATARRLDLFSQGRPGSGSSAAADDLKRLTRDDSAERRQSSRWSVISGLWGTRRRESINKIPVLNDEHNRVKSRRTSAAMPSTTTDPGFTQVSVQGYQKGPRDSTPPPRTSADTLGLSDSTGATPKLERTPDPSGAFESPVKTSINDDGVIDVDIPLPDFLTTFESAVSSPSSSGYLSAPGFGSGLESFENSARFSADGDVTVNVAGFLQHYHPDFVLQALPPQDDLMKQLKASMRAEPTPQLPPNAPPAGVDSERWVDVSSAIVADATTFTITRITYRRLVRPRSPTDRTFAPTPSPNAVRSSTPAAHPYEMQVKDEFIEELIVSLDETLVEAVEKVISTGGADMVSKNSSSCSSRSTSKRRERSNSTSTQGDIRSSSNQGIGGLAPDPPPRSKCKTVLLGALEDIIQDILHEKRRREQEESGPERSSPSLRERGSILREAVRGWLESVDNEEC
ncbi:folliculin-interacting protein N-terminus-domain-containing protein [Cladorrhinum sp. PSN259]|nr:folliculin-interacting protein N-terminus-domain-containing protein [Cladorrhinum sp. PSN259]